MGVRITRTIPGLYFGVSMTLMQMIEVGALPKVEITPALAKAARNIDECLRIAPEQQDYLDARQVIAEYRKKYVG